MTQTLGQTIGKVRHTGSIKNDAGDKVQIGIYIDFSTCTDTDISNWLCANRFIAGQRPWRSLSIDELKGLDGQTFLASDIGKKVKSRAEKLAVYTAMGLPEAMAAIAVDDPVKFQTMMAAVETTEDE